MIELRPYQEECVKRVLDAYEWFRSEHNPCRGDRGELLVLPTGGGKTVIFSAVINELNKRYGLNALIIAHRDELLNQAADKYRLVKPDAIIGKVGSGIHQYGGEVTVASVATISRPDHLKRLKAIGYGLIIVDEAHHQAAASYQKVLAALPDAFVLSVTATPKRLDGKNISHKPPLYQATIIDMIQQGYLCDIKAVAIRTEANLDDVKSTAGDFNEHELDLAVNTPARNRRIVLAYQEHSPGKRAVAFCVTVAHARALCHAFNDMGVPAAVIDGDMLPEERQPIYKAFDRGDIKILCNCMVLTEGWDAPLCEVCILARPTQSQGLYIQMAGRVLRPAPGKKCAVFLDITDNCTRHRIAPQNFRRVIKHTKGDETLLEAMEREENEQAEREAREKRAIIRKLNEKRDKDITIDIFGLPEWQERENGLFVLEVGMEKHRIAIAPTPSSAGFAQLYDVYARLAPTYEGQVWLRAQPLDWAMQEAEKRARMILANKSKLVDRNAPWRNDPISEGQAGMLKMYRIAFGEGTSITNKGEAADAISKRKQEIAARKAAKEARKQEASA